MKMNNRTIKTTVDNIVKGMEIARETAIVVAINEYRNGEQEKAEATVKRYNKQFQEAFSVASTLCILSCESYTENMMNFLDKVQSDLNYMHISFADDIMYEVDKENWE